MKRYVVEVGYLSGGQTGRRLLVVCADNEQAAARSARATVGSLVGRRSAPGAITVDALASVTVLGAAEEVEERCTA